MRGCRINVALTHHVLAHHHYRTAEHEPSYNQVIAKVISCCFERRSCWALLSRLLGPASLAHRDDFLKWQPLGLTDLRWEVLWLGLSEAPRWWALSLSGISFLDHASFKHQAWPFLHQASGFPPLPLRGSVMLTCQTDWLYLLVSTLQEEPDFLALPPWSAR